MEDELGLFSMKHYPIIDLHCDLLSYLSSVPGAHVNNADEFGATTPHLKAGNVKLQVMAIYTDSKPGSTLEAEKQRTIYQQLPLLSDGFFVLKDGSHLNEAQLHDIPGCMAWLAIENASGFCEEDEKLDEGLKRLCRIVEQSGPLAYIIVTHHYENRFGGGNYSDVGLKPDGEVLLDYLHGKRIPIDLAHTSDKLAYGLLNYIDKKNLDIPVLASHSNFRQIHGHVRNLPDELTLELVRRSGLIGINLVRNYINDSSAEVLYDHISHGVKLGAEHLLALGADFFYALNHPDPSRYPIYYPGQDNASFYQEILKRVRELGKGQHFDEAMAFGNVLSYYGSIL